MQAARACVRTGLSASFVVARSGNELGVRRPETVPHPGHNHMVGYCPPAGEGLGLHVPLESDLGEMLFFFFFFFKSRLWSWHSLSILST